MFHFYCYRKKHKHFGLSNVRKGRRSLVKSVKEVVVVSVSLHHQQCDNFRKIQLENAKWIGAVILYVTFRCLLPTGAPLKACTKLLWGPECLVHCEVDGVWTCCPDPPWKISSSSMSFEENELLDAWPLDDGRAGCRCDTPGSSSKPPSSSELLSFGPLLRNSGCPKPVHIFGVVTITTDWLLRKEYSFW